MITPKEWKLLERIIRETVIEGLGATQRHAAQLGREIHQEFDEKNGTHTTEPK